MSMLRAFGSAPNRDEGEKPFWISYADLMTALMILFLVIMVAALAAITKQAEELTKRSQKVDEPTLVKQKKPEVVKTDARFQEIYEICSQISDKASAVNPNLNVDCRLNRINFGEVGRFKTDEYKMNADGEAALAQIVPVILETANTTTGKKWLKQVVIEGYTDTDGSYLYNLNLSLKRSEWVMCTLLRNDTYTTTQFTPEQRKQVKKLFLAGGVAFNNIRDSKDASRRVELKLQFYGEADEHKASSDYELKFDDSSKERCML